MNKNVLESYNIKFLLYYRYDISYIVTYLINLCSSERHNGLICGVSNECVFLCCNKYKIPSFRSDYATEFLDFLKCLLNHLV